jgi:hypothetical protein
MNAIRIRYMGIVRIVLIALASLLGVLCIVTGISRGCHHGDISGLVSRYNRSGEEQQAPPEDPKKSKKAKSPKDKRVAAIQERNIFAPPKKKDAFKGKLLGVLGDSAIFDGGKFVKVGETYSGAKLKKIGADYVELTFKGKSVKLSVFAGGPSPPGRGPMVRSSRMVRGGPVSPSSSRRPSPPRDFKLTPEMIQRFKEMPPEMREKALSSMPPEMRKQIEQAN